MPVYLSIKKPLTWADLLWYYGDSRETYSDEDVADYARSQIDGRGMVNYFETSHKQAEWMWFIKDGGFDGIILQDPDELYNGIYIALNPSQIKSVFNRGEWKQDDPRLSESAGIPPELEPDWGVKIGKNARFFRGESETSGSNGASYGAGLYTTTSRKFASNYGKVRELSRWDALPDNPIRFRTNWDWEMWLQRYDQYHGILGARDRGQKHNDIGDYIRLVFPNADGAQIGTGNDAIFVKWPISETERGQ